MSFDYKINGLTIAVVKMEEMIEFYSNVFDIEFGVVDMYDEKLYSGCWGELKILFCPAELANNSAKQNRHQFDIEVSDLSNAVKMTVNFGGVKMGEITKSHNELSIGIYDPDNNSIVFKQVIDNDIG